MGRVIVIDGPAGSGKSTTAIALARKLGYIYLDTGAMYRALTLKFLKHGLKALDNKRAIPNILNSTSIKIEPSAEGLKIFLDGRDVTEKIRDNEVDRSVSEVSAVPEVREFLQILQKQFARQFDLVAEGRDLGTFVFPEADVKIFMVADLDTRARRRLKQKQAPSGQLGLLRQNLAMRDKIDSGRKHSPLKKADDAIEVDTSGLKFDEQVNKIYDICRQKIG
jgi:cytidylate kinase